MIYNVHTNMHTCSANSEILIDSNKQPCKVGIWLILTELVTLSEDPFRLFTIAVLLNKHT